MRGDNDNTSEILRSDYQLVRGGEGLGSGGFPQTQSINTNPISSKPEKGHNGDDKINIIRSNLVGSRRTIQERVSSDSPPKRQKTEPDLIPKPSVIGDPGPHPG